MSIIPYIYTCKQGEIAAVIKSASITEINECVFGAAFDNRCDIVKLLFDNGATYFKQALYAACRYGYKDIVELIVNSKDTKIEFYDEYTLRACEYGQYEILKFLIQKKCLLTSYSYYRTRSGFADKETKHKIIFLLFETGITIRSSDCRNTVYGLLDAGCVNFKTKTADIQSFIDNAKLARKNKICALSPSLNDVLYDYATDWCSDLGNIILEYTVSHSNSMIKNEFT